MIDSYLTTAEAGLQTGRCRAWIARLCRMGRLPRSRWLPIGRGVWLVHPDDISVIVELKPGWRPGVPFSEQHRKRLSRAARKRHRENSRKVL